MGRFFTFQNLLRLWIHVVDVLYHSQILASRDAEGKAAQMRDDIKVLEAYILATETATHVRDVAGDSLCLYMTAKMPEDELLAHKMSKSIHPRDPLPDK